MPKLFGRSKGEQTSTALVRTFEAGSAAHACAATDDIVVSAHADGSVIVWDLKTGERRATLTGHRDAVADCAVRPDGSTVVSASHDGTLRAWDVAGGGDVTLVGHSGAVLAVALAPDGSYAVSAGADGTLRVWDLAGGRERAVMVGHEGAVRDVLVAPDGRLALSAGFWWNKDRTALRPVLQSWDAFTGDAQPLVLQGHEGEINACAIPPDGGWMASASADHTVRVWALKTKQHGLVPETAAIFKGHGTVVWDCAFSPDGTYVVSGDAAGLLKVWRAVNAGERSTLRGHRKEVLGCCFTPDGSLIVSASADGTVRCWDAISAAVWGKA